MGTSVREPGKEHIPRYPPGWITIRILQLILACVILGLNAYLVINWIATGFYLEIFASVCTLICSIWLICAHSCAPRAFNYWAVLILDIYLYCLWLAAFSYTAVNAVWILGRHSSNSYLYDFDFDGYFKLAKRRKGGSYGGGSSSSSSSSSDGDSVTTSGAIAAAAAGLGALMFLFYFICLITDAVVIYRHRKVGLHARRTKTYGGGVVMQSGPVGVPSAYQAVPQQGIPYQQPVTAYNPNGMYNPQTAYQSQPLQQATYPYPVAKSVSPAPPSSTPTPQPYSPQPQYPVQQTQPPTGGY